MRRTTAGTQTRLLQRVPRGWIVLGAALASWVVFAGLWAGVGQLFTFIAGVI